MFKGQTIRKLMGGRAGEVEKKYSHKGKLNLKKFMHEKYSCYSEKKIHTRNLITKKNSCSSKIPPPPHNFSNGPFLIHTSIVGVSLNPIKPTIIFLTRIIQMRKWGGVMISPTGGRRGE